jgi:hypothetical protein
MARLGVASRAGSTDFASIALLLRSAAKGWLAS